MTTGLPMNWPPQPTYTQEVLLRDPVAKSYLTRALGHLGSRVVWSAETDDIRYGRGGEFWRIESGPRDALTVRALIKECDEMEAMASSPGVEVARFL